MKTKKQILKQIETYKKRLEFEGNTTLCVMLSSKIDAWKWVLEIKDKPAQRLGKPILIIPEA